MTITMVSCGATCGRRWNRLDLRLKRCLSSPEDQRLEHHHGGLVGRSIFLSKWMICQRPKVPAVHLPGCILLKEPIGIHIFFEASSELEHSLEMQKVYRHMARWIFFYRFPGDNDRGFVARKPYKNGGLNVNELLKLGKRKIKKWHTDPTQKRTQLIGFEQRHWFWVIGCMWWSEVLLRKFRNFEKWWLEDHFPFEMVLFREHVSSLKIRFGWPSSVFIALCQDHEARWLIRNQSLSEFWKSHMQ